MDHQARKSYTTQIFALCGATIFCAIAFFNVGGCAQGTQGGIGGSGVHGEVSTTIDPTTGEVGQVAGKIYFTKRPLIRSEKQAIYQTAFNDGVQFFGEGGEAHWKITERHWKDLLTRRMAYKYRVVASKLKPIVEEGFEAGAKSAGEP